MYRGLLKTLARVWNPKDFQGPAIQQKVLAQMQAAERGFRRLDAALERVEPEALTQILRYLNLQSLTQVTTCRRYIRSCLRLKELHKELR
jgi:hypothetical protein